MCNLKKTLAAVSLFAPASVYALGIGDIKLHSALNQNLDAEIALLVSADEDISDIKVRLAHPSKFDEAGVPWNYFLSKIKFEAVTRADGSTVVTLSSKEALREPFLDFLLEVTWDKGSLYREFTVLVDPPVAYTQPVMPIIEKPVQVKVPKTQPVVIRPPVIKKQISNYNQTTTSDKYGPTKRGDTLWSVSEKTNSYGDISREQMMMAIFEVNPKAFHKDNINFLKGGYTLDIPEKEVILSLSKKEATAAFSKKIEKWGGSLVSKQYATHLQKLASKVDTSVQLELQAPSEAAITERSVVGSKINKKSGNEKYVALASAETAVLKSRMEKLEEQLTMMQKMLVVNDEQIAAIQSHQALLKAARADLKQNSSVDNQKDEENGKKIKTTETIIKSEPDTNAADPRENRPLENEVITDKVAEETRPELVNEAKKITRPEPIKMVEDSSLDTQPEVEAIAEEAAEGTLSPLTLAALGIPALGLLGWFFWRRKRDEKGEEAESMFASASEIGLPDSDIEELSDVIVDRTSDLVSDEESESSLLTEFGSSDFTTFDSEKNEVDPILEADVYLAYGRYQQAEDLMRQAILDQPERDECKLKLLEILHANENKAAFSEYTTTLKESNKQNDKEFWGKVVAMGAELNLDPALFAEDSGDKATFDIDDSDIDSTLESEAKPEPEVNVDLNDNASTEIFDIDSEQTELVSLNENQEFDLSIFDEDEDNLGTGGEENINDNSSLDFNLDQIDDDLSEAAVSVPTQKTPTSEAKTDNGLNNDLDDLDFSLDSLSTDIDLEDTEANDQKFENFDDFDFDTDLTSETPEASNKDISDLTYLDEMEAKIDLAKAYLEMEDIDSAKVIAEEVFKNGSDNQKKAVQSILDKQK